MNTATPSYDLGFGLFRGIPQKNLFRRAVKIQLLAALAWEYCDTVLDISVQMRIQATKSLTRTIRKCRSDYDYRVLQSIDKEHCDRAVELSELFETITQPLLDKLVTGLQFEIRRNDLLRRDYETLVVAVLMAMTVLDALKMFCHETDVYISEYYPLASSSIFPPELATVARLLPQYLGDISLPDSESRRITSRALLNELKNIELYNEYGKV